MESETNFKLIGYLVPRETHDGFNVVGLCCIEQVLLERYNPLYEVNVGPYGQTCHVCDSILVEPQAADWPELFGKGEARFTISHPDCPERGFSAAPFFEHRETISGNLLLGCTACGTRISLTRR